jgi:divalent metal cation (Fe/Co/Zn/Cd) transporter
VSQDEAPAVVRIDVPVDHLDVIHKAIEQKLEENPKESVDVFINQNPATKKMIDIVRESYDAMTAAMLKEIEDVFRADSK